MWKDLVPSFVNILKQVLTILNPLCIGANECFSMKIIQNKLSRHYEYHHVPAPWIQVKLLRLLAVLGADDKKYCIVHTMDIMLTPKNVGPASRCMRR